MRALALAATALVALAGTKAAETQDATLVVRRVAGNVYVINAGTERGNNVAALIGGDGVLLVKGQDGDPALVSALRTVTDKPGRYVVEPQCDAAPLGAPQRAGAIIVAHENVRRRFEEKKCDNDDAALPTFTFGSEMTLHFDGEEVRIIKLPTGHSDNDAIVYFKRANVVAIGDTYGSVLPGYTKYAGGNMLGVAQQLRTIVALLPADVTVVPGFGRDASIGDLRTVIKTLDEIKNAITEQIAMGKTLEQLRAMDVLAPWRDATGPVGSRDRADYLKSFYDCLTGPPDPKFQL